MKLSDIFVYTIIGSHCVGKTTFGNSLVKTLKGMGFKVDITKEAARKFPNLINEGSTPETQSLILEKQEEMEEELKESGIKVLVTDRGKIDNFAYWKRVAEKNGVSPEAIKEKQKEVFEYSSKQYDVIAFLGLFDGEIEKDGIRSPDDEWRIEMHNRVSEVVDLFKANYDTPIVYLRGNEEKILKQGIIAFEHHFFKKNIA
ncbi:MAG: ATP-binding protein [Patescibacteria group bacterium]|nr:ATP-binding protein [Patescibacteria group bacterium]